MSTSRTRKQRRWLYVLGSMNLAITLLVGLAIASVAGTILKQNQPNQDYLIKFGPFWHQIYRTLGLYDVYTCAWFLAVLTFLVVSTSVCIWLNTPRMLKSMRDYQENTRRDRLRHMPQQAQWQVAVPAEQVIARAAQLFRENGYRFKQVARDGEVVLAGQKGAANRLGYLFTHLAIVVICVGGLVDGNLPLKMDTLFGKLRIETQDLPLKDVPRNSFMPVSNHSFRADVSIPEGGHANAAFINLSDGFLVQPLPFSIALKRFHIEHYPTGQPKSFASDVVISAPGQKAPLDATVAVNHPVTFRGYTIFQSSFGDGGSKLHMQLYRFGDSPKDPEAINGAVNDTLSPADLNGQTIELTDFRAYNVNPVAAGDGAAAGEKFRNFGPSFTYKLRQPDGTAKEYFNYMQPNLIGKRYYLLSGVRSSPAEAFHYLHIPVDNQDGPDRFLRFVHLMRDPDAVRAVVPDVIAETVTPDRSRLGALQPDLEKATLRLVSLFNEGGFDAVSKFVDKAVPAKHRAAAKDAYFKLLESTLRDLYLRCLNEEGIDTTKGVGQDDSQFFGDAVAAATALHVYGSPFYLRLHDFQQIQSSGLQITRAPGKNIVYLGFALLISGVFLMFYLPHQRLWAIVAADGSQTIVTMVGQRLRHERDFAQEFERLRRLFSGKLG